MSSSVFRVVLIACGTLCVALGVIGIFVPLMPTTVFLLLAAACYARSSETRYRRLLENKWLGHYIRNTHERRGMTRRHKVFTLALLWVGIGATAFFSVHAWWARLLLAAVAVGVTVHVARLPLAPPAALPEPQRATE
jgi:uncharacterized membrane protein YbaN (DUF454 family)